MKQFMIFFHALIACIKDRLYSLSEPIVEYVRVHPSVRPSVQPFARSRHGWVFLQESEQVSSSEAPPTSHRWVGWCGKDNNFVPYVREENGQYEANREL